MKTYFKMLWEDPAACRKALLALMAVVAQVVAVVAPVTPWTSVVIALATALGVYHVRNDKPTSKELRQALKERGNHHG